MAARWQAIGYRASPFASSPLGELYWQRPSVCKYRFDPSLTVASNTPAETRAGRGFRPVPEMGVYLGILQVQERLRIGGGGLIFSKFNRLFASGVGSVTCQTVPLGLNNCAN